MNNFTYLKGNCPVCSGARKDCRQLGNLYFCRGENPNLNFNFKKFDAQGFAIYILASLEVEQSGEARNSRRQEWEREKQLRIEREAKANAELLSVEERDREIRKLLSQISLSDVHREDLKRRGLSDKQIERGMFRSILPFQKLKHQVSDRLAGVSIGGRTLCNIDEGYICPVWNSDGLIIGWQLRTANSEAKYKWATSKWKKRLNGPTSKLQNGELPLTVCRPKNYQPDLGIGLAEGILKPWIAATLSRQVFVGAAGGNFASSPQQLKLELQKLSEELGTKRILLYPDSGTVNNANVMQAYRKLYKLLKDWDYELAIGWWGQEYDDRENGIDDLLASGKGAEITYLYFSDWERINNQRLRSGHSFNKLFNSTFAIVKTAVKGFGKTKGKRNEKLKLAEKSDFLLPSDKPVEYQAGERRATTAKIAATRQFIFDSSAPGTGKSYDAGLYQPSDFDCDRIIYISAQHRNATTPSLASWEDLESRHNGLYQDKFGAWKRADKDNARETAPTCDRTKLIDVFRDKNIAGADTANLICPTCPQFEGCRSGDKFGFLQMRSATLKTERFRAHPDSLPYPSKFPYAAADEEEEEEEEEKKSGKGKGTVLIWEEWSEILRFCKHITVVADDVEHIFANLLSADVKGFGSDDALLRLWEFLSGKHQIPKWGLPHAEVVKLFKPLLEDGVDISEIASVTNPGKQVQEILHGLLEHGVSLSDLNAGMRKRFAKKDEELAEQAQVIAKQWLIPFLEVLLGRVKGYLHLEQGKLTVTVPDRRLIEIAHAAKANIFLDATGDIEKLALILGTHRTHIAHIQQIQPPGAKLEIQQIRSLGRLGMSQTLEQTRKVGVLMEKLNPDLVITPKKHSKEGELCWFSESRGVNIGERAATLAVIGSPCRPIGILAAEFAILHGYAPNLATEEIQRRVNQIEANGSEYYITSKESVDPKFREFVRHDILATVEQGFGRLRANRRFRESLTIYFLGDFCLDRPVKLVRAIDVALEAGTVIEKLEMAIVRFARKVAGSGEKLTLTAIAKFCGVCKQRISQLIQELGWQGWTDFKKRLVSLIESYSKTRQTNSRTEIDELDLDTDYISLSPEKEIECMMTHIGSLPISVVVSLLEAIEAPFDTQLTRKLPSSGNLKPSNPKPMVGFEPTTVRLRIKPCKSYGTTFSGILTVLLQHRDKHTNLFCEIKNRVTAGRRKSKICVIEKIRSNVVE